MTVLELGQGVTLYQGDCRDYLPLLWDLHACVTDPPYHLTMTKRLGRSNPEDVEKNFTKTIPGQGTNPFKLAARGFMGKEWDGGDVSFDPATWEAVLASLLPGAHLIGFAGTRTYHRIACAIEDAGFDCRDMVSWVYGSGFPKSLDVSKAIDKEAGAERETTGKYTRPDGTTRQLLPRGVGIHEGGQRETGSSIITAPATEAASRWQGWGTALKPAFEPACLARKPLDQKTVAQNVLTHGTGGLNIDACRIESGPDHAAKCASVVGLGSNRNGNCFGEWTGQREDSHSPLGRWPANLCHDGSEEVLALFPHTKSGGGDKGGHGLNEGRNCYGAYTNPQSKIHAANSGSAARFFYCAKVSPKERGDSKHPTMKPVALMEWLCKLVTPPGGTILDPFMGSGSTGVAAVRNGFGFIGIEQDPESFETARKRIEAELRQHNYRAVHPVKAIEEEEIKMSTLLEIAGGKDAILRASHAVSPLAVDVHSVLRLARVRFISTFGADIENRFDTAHQMHILMQGERPQAPSDEADAWDDGLISECDQVTTEALRLFDLWQGSIAERWSQALETFSVLEHEWAKGGQTLAEFIWREKIETKDSPAKQLSALGITVKEIEAYWTSQGPLAASVAPITSFAPTTSEGSAGDESASPLAPAAATSAASPVPIFPSAAAIAVDATSPASASTVSPSIKKSRGRKRAHVALTLPGVIFQTLRAVGISDKTLAEASGISRSTVSRVCAGDQTEIGVSPDEFKKLTEFAAAKMAEIQEVLGTLSFFEVGA